MQTGGFYFYNNNNNTHNIFMFLTPFHANLIDLNFYPLEVVSRYRDP